VIGSDEHLFEIVDSDPEDYDEDPPYNQSDLLTSKAPNQLPRPPSADKEDSPVKRNRFSSSGSDHERPGPPPPSMGNMNQNFQNLLMIADQNNIPNMPTTPIPPYVDSNRFSPGIPIHDPNASSDSERPWFSPGSGHPENRNTYDSFQQMPQMANTSFPNLPRPMFDPRHNLPGGYFIPSPGSSSSKNTTPSPKPDDLFNNQQRMISMRCVFCY